LNGLQVVGKNIGEVKMVVSGAGAAALACVDLLLDLGLVREHVWLTDLAGVVYEGRQELMDPEKQRFSQPTGARTLREVIGGADIFLGLSAGGVLTGEMVGMMAMKPLILALANPTPEILPEEVRAVRSDAVIATGRSDYPNQVNNVLCFPFVFRGALDVGATTITRQMEIASVHAIAELARQEQSDVVAAAYGDMEGVAFGAEYLIPKPFDPRLIVKIAPAVAKAAMESGVATRPITDMDAYCERLLQFVYHSGTLMQPIFAAARKIGPGASRIVYAEGEDERVLRTAQSAVDEKLATPILVGRPAVIERAIKRYGLRLRIGEHVTVVNPEHDERDDRTQWGHCAICAPGDAPAHHVDCGDALEEGRGGRDDLRDHQHHGTPSALHRSGAGPARRRECVWRHERLDPSRPPGIHRRHARQSRSHGGTAGRTHAIGGRSVVRIRPYAQGGVAVAFELRFQ
jgi:malate dehydrogenase (oxaloacetate-decarboxylating)(NADP+)